MNWIKELINNDKFIIFIGKKIIELWDYSKLLFIIIFLILISSVLFYSLFATLLFGNIEDSNGKLLTLILSIIGAIFVIYGLRINSRRLKQGNEQLLQQEKNNTNTRFKDAVTLLGSDNPAVVLGGIHTLNQIAIDNIEYREIVADILCSNIREKSVDLVNKSSNSGYSSIMQLIINYLFTESYYGIELNLSYAKFENMIFNDLTYSKFTINHCIFKNCRFNILHLTNDQYGNIQFYNCKIQSIQFTKTNIYNFKFIECDFHKEFSIINTNFIDLLIDHCPLRNINITNADFDGLIISDSKFFNGNITDTEFDGVSQIDKCTFFKIKLKNSDLVESFTNNRYIKCENLSMDK